VPDSMIKFIYFCSSPLFGSHNKFCLKRRIFVGLCKKIDYTGGIKIKDISCPMVF
jgi:hypothetical protein